MAPEFLKTVVLKPPSKKKMKQSAATVPYIPTYTTQVTMLINRNRNHGYNYHDTSEHEYSQMPTNSGCCLPTTETCVFRMIRRCCRPYLVALSDSLTAKTVEDVLFEKRQQCCERRLLKNTFNFISIVALVNNFFYYFITNTLRARKQYLPKMLIL